MGTDKRERQKAGRQARIEAARIAEQRAKRRRTLLIYGGGVVAIIVVLFLLSRLGGSSKTTASTSSGTTTSSAASASSSSSSATSTTVAALPAGAAITGDTPCPAADGSSPRTTKFAKPPPTCIDPAKTYTATFDTSEGKVVVKLDTTTTPNTTNNFVVLSRYHYYDGTQLFRTDPSIGIIQGGAPSNSASDPGPGYNLADEGFDYTAINGTGGPYKYAPGDLVMARTSQPNGAGAQFFFGASSAVSNLDSQGVYVKFGTTTSGLDVLQNILALNQANSSGLGGAPSRPVTVSSVTITES